MSDTVTKMRAAFNMTKQRCYNPRCRDYAYYGGRGIRICDRWLASFDSFVEDMGLRPEGATLERVDNDGPYSPDNCRWATRAEQSCNTRAVDRITHQGETLTIAEWERKLGWKPGVLKARLNRLGYSIEEAFTKPVKCGGKLPHRTYRLRDTTSFQRFPHTADQDLVRFMADAGKPLHGIAAWFGTSLSTVKKVVNREGCYR